jgi:2'-5' RNA ligase
MPALRLFLAIDIPLREKESITTIQNQFKNLGHKISLVRSNNIHLTLKFLGDTPLGQVADINKNVAKVVNSTPIFVVSLNGIEVFPNFKKPKVLWIGLKDPQKYLKALHEKINGKMMQLGFPKERGEFTPHITFARIKKSKGEIKKKSSELKQRVVSIPPIDSEYFEVDSVRLMQSELKAEGSIYTILGKFPFVRK